MKMKSKSCIIVSLILININLIGKCFASGIVDSFVKDTSKELYLACKNRSSSFADVERILISVPDKKTLKEVVNYFPEENSTMTPLLAIFVSLEKFENPNNNFNSRKQQMIPEDRVFRNVKLLLEAGADPNIALFDGATALLFASIYKQSRYISLLLEYGAEANVINFNGDTPLLCALDMVDLDLVYMLLRAGAKCDYSVQFKSSPQFMFPDDYIFELNLNFFINSSGETPLLCALKRNDLHMFSVFLGAGAEPTYANRFKTQRGTCVLPRDYKYVPIDFEAIKTLVTEKDITAQIRLLEYVPELMRFEIAYELGFIDILRRLYKDGCVIKRCTFLKKMVIFDHKTIRDPLNLLISSALDQNISVFKARVYQNQDLTLRYPSGFCSLFNARRLAAGFEIEFIESIVYTSYFVLEAACFVGNLEIVEFLISLGVGATETAFKFALKRGDIDIFNILLDAEYFYYDRDLRNTVPGDLTSLIVLNERFFFAAILSGNFLLVERFLNEFEYVFNETSCIIAIKCGHFRCVELCKDLNLIELNTVTLELAAQSGNVETFKYLHNFIDITVPTDNDNDNNDNNINVNINNNINGTTPESVSNTAESVKTSFYLKLAGYAAINGHLEMVLYFKNELNISPSLSDLKLTKKVEILKLFPEIFPLLSPLNLDSISASGDLEFIKRVITRNWYFFGWSNFRSAHLTIAAEHGHLEVVKYFVEKVGISTDYEILEGPTRNGHFEVVDYLFHYGHVSKGNFPFDTCIKHGQVRCFRLYLNYVQKVNFPDYLMDHIVCSVIKSDNLEMVQFIHSFGDRYRAKLTKFSEYAVIRRHWDILVYLMQKGIPLSHPSKEDIIFTKFGRNILESHGDGDDLVPLLSEASTPTLTIARFLQMRNNIQEDD